MANQGSGFGFVTGFILGGIVGVVVGILITPRASERARAFMLDNGAKFGQRTETLADQARDRAGGMAEQTKDRAEYLADQARMRMRDMAVYVREIATGHIPEDPSGSEDSSPPPPIS